MKNLILNINLQKKFNKERSILVKLQIDNSLDLGWKKKDILLVTNWDYEYNGVKSLQVEDDNYVGIDDTRYQYKVSTHIPTINTMFKKGYIEKGEMYWYHDMDAYQLHKIDEEELGMKNIDMGLSDYGWSAKWNGGSIFFKYSAKDLFKFWRDKIYEYQLGDERVLVRLTKEKQIDERRLKRLNITYNFGMRHVEYNYRISNKPLKVLHFHPYYNDRLLPDTTMNIFRYGKNGMGEPLMTKRLIKIFDKYGLK